MVSGTGRKTIAVAGVLAAIAGGAVIARADDPRAGTAQAIGGLAVDGVNLERTARAGAANELTLTNRSKKALAVTVTPRAWKQSASGVASPDRRAALTAVGVSEGSFTLAPGAEKKVAVTLNSVPSAGYLYGVLEIVGLPTDLDKAKGVVAGYRVLSALRYNSSAPVYSAKAGAAKVTGKGAAKAITLKVTNTGNTIAPISGTVLLKKPLGTDRPTIKGVRILPKKSVALTLASGSSLQPGTYTATVTLIQKGKNIATIKKTVKIR